MNKQVKTVTIFGLALVTLWDTFTTITGTMSIIGNNNVQLFISILFGVIITSFLLNTMPLLKNPKDDLIILGGKLLWFLAFGYDLFTSFTGNIEFITQSASNDIAQISITVGLTIFVSSSPITISYIISETDSI